MARSDPPSIVPNPSQKPSSGLGSDGVIAGLLLDWYNLAARDLPWRVGPAERALGTIPDPYAVWLSEVMLQQTTVATVTPRYREFLRRWPRVTDLAAAPVEDVMAEWAGLGYYARARNLHKCAREIAAHHDGRFPQTANGLRELPGIGPYTAAAIAAIAFDEPVTVVDGNIERVVSRLFAIETPLPSAKKEIGERTNEIWPSRRSGDFAQGLMDLGATICTPRNPSCLLCPIQSMCAAFRAGTMEQYPVKAAKKPKPTRTGVVFVTENAKGEVLFERRPDKGMLGGMLGLPGTDWHLKTDSGEAVQSFAPSKASYEPCGEVEHTFTHYHLILQVRHGCAPRGTRAKCGQIWGNPATTRLPTLMQKAINVYLKKKDD